MSKKPQTQPKEAQKPKVETIEEESDPVLKGLQKKVRNINKKLNQIAELEGKENLKPEQIEKIGRKNNLLEERSRIEESATLFKQVYAENAAIYRSNQLKELEVLARAITILHFAPKVQQNNKTLSLWQSLEQTNFTNGTFNDAILSLGNSLKDFANDRKLQKALNTFIEEHGSDIVSPQTSHQEQILNVILQEKQETVKVDAVPEAKLQTSVVATPVVLTVASVEPASVIPPVVVETKKVEVEVKSNEDAILSETKANNSQAIAPVQNKIAGQRPETSNNDRKVGYKTNGPKDYKRGEYKGNYKERKQGDEKKQYKPKYTPKEPEQKPQQVHDSDSDYEPEARRFRREEIKELENDGFIVVGKPKINQTTDRRPNQGVKYNQRT